MGLGHNGLIDRLKLEQLSLQMDNFHTDCKVGRNWSRTPYVELERNVVV